MPWNPFVRNDEDPADMSDRRGSIINIRRLVKTSRRTQAQYAENITGDITGDLALYWHRPLNLGIVLGR